MQRNMIVYICACLLVLCQIAGMSFAVIKKTEHAVTAESEIVLYQIQNRVTSTFRLLDHLAMDDWLISPALTYEQKAARLAVLNQSCEYKMLRILDRQGNMYEEDGTIADHSIYEKDYIQQLWTGSDTRAADVVGVVADATERYYFFVAPVGGNARLHGALLAAVSDKEFQQYLQRRFIPVALCSKSEQIIASTSLKQCGQMLCKNLSGFLIFAPGSGNVFEDMKHGGSGFFWSVQKGIPVFYAYRGVGCGTDWIILAHVSVIKILWHMPMGIALFFGGLLFTGALTVLYKMKGTE